MSRRLVTVLFLDIVGWTALSERVDPEPLQLLLEEYYELCSAAVTEHGGEVEKYIGDAVMAVFGASTSQEDDAVRALRAAFQIRSSVHDLLSVDAGTVPMEVHSGIAAGEVLVTRSSLAGLRVVGDVVNLAARLQSMAAAGQIIVNEIVAQLVRQHFTMLPVPAFTLKGKTDPVRALLVTGPADVADADAESAEMVDRTVERTRLLQAFDRVSRERRAQAMFVLGPLGIGKTRLVREAASQMRTAQLNPPTVVIGTCPFYGPRENHAALAEVLEALVREAEPSRELLHSNERIAAALASLHDGSPISHDDTGPGPGMEEVSWAARELLTAASAGGPLVVVWDNLGRAGRSLLRLIGELLASLEHLPLLMIGIGRHQQLAESDAPWIRNLPGLNVIQLEALNPADSAQLAASWASMSGVVEVEAHTLEVVERVATHGTGNPLFIRLIMDSAAMGMPLDHVPPTITAVVGAMIDRLPEPARELLGAASVIGPTFTLEHLALLYQSIADIESLLQRQLIRPGPQHGEYSFVEHPVHEIAYARLKKERRVSLHRRLAEHNISRAFHLEAAFRLLSSLRSHDPELAALARDTSEALLADGTAALRQRDIPTAIDLLERASKYAIEGQASCRTVAGIRLSDALMFTGDTQRAMDVVTATARHGLDEPIPWAALMQQRLLALRLGAVLEVSLEQIAVDLHDGDADGLAWCRFEQLRMQANLKLSHFVDADRAACAALEHARRVGDVYEEDRLLVALCEVRQWSPTPVAERLSVCYELAERFALDRVMLIPVLAAQARNLALIGDRPGSWAALEEAGTAVDQLQLIMGRVVLDQTAGLACSLEGQHLRAERHLRSATAILERVGAAHAALTMQVAAARAHARRHPGGQASEEVATLLKRREEMDMRGRILCMSTAVRLAAADGVAHPMLEDVLPLLAETDDPCMHGDVYFDLAEGRRCLGDDAGARAMAEAAIDSYATVGAAVPMRSVQAWI